MNSRVFSKALDLWCGREDGEELTLIEFHELASVADRFQMTEVVAVLESTMIGSLRFEMCGELLSWSGSLGLIHLEAAALCMAAKRFEELKTSEGFMKIEEDALGMILDTNELAVRSEEGLWEAVVGWMKAEGQQLRGRSLLHKIRFPLMEEDFLRSGVSGMIPAEHQDWIEGLVEEALRAKAAHKDGAPFQSTLLTPHALVPRLGMGVRWEEYLEGGERRLEHSLGHVCALARCEGRMCGGSMDGSIRMWGAASLEHERTMPEDIDDLEAIDSVFALAAWEGRLVSAHDCGLLRVWDARTGACEQALAGHTRHVLAVAVCGARLVSGSADRSLRVWAAGPAGLWACERTLLGHEASVFSVAAWRDKALSASGDRTVRVWDAATGASEAVLRGHGGAVYALAVHRDRVASASGDGTIRVWAAGTWAALRAVEACDGRPRHFPRCLAVSGARLISGSCTADADGQPELRVWDLERLECEVVLRQPADVLALAAADGEVWAGVGHAVVVWGREPARPPRRRAARPGGRAERQ